MRLGEDVCLTTYFNVFDSNMEYTLWDKDPRMLRDSYKMIVNIDNNRRATSKLGRRDNPKIFNPREIRKKVKNLFQPNNLVMIQWAKS